MVSFVQYLLHGVTIFLTLFIFTKRNNSTWYCSYVWLRADEFFTMHPDYAMDSNVVKAWYIHVLKFLPLVKKSREATAPDKLKNASLMFLFIQFQMKLWFVGLLKFGYQFLLRKKMQRKKIKVKTNKR